jgi:hypothetical protein
MLYVLDSKCPNTTLYVGFVSLRLLLTIKHRSKIHTAKRWLFCIHGPNLSTRNDYIDEQCLRPLLWIQIPRRDFFLLCSSPNVQKNFLISLQRSDRCSGLEISENTLQVCFVSLFSCLLLSSISTIKTGKTFGWAGLNNHPNARNTFAPARRSCTGDQIWKLGSSNDMLLRSRLKITNGSLVFAPVLTEYIFALFFLVSFICISDKLYSIRL